MIVKFSAADSSSTVQRWADLLVCEHLALEAVRSIPGVQSARSRILRHQGRTFLEVERFDRHGLFGRSPLCSLETLEASLLAKTSTDWGDAGELARNYFAHHDYLDSDLLNNADSQFLLGGILVSVLVLLGMQQVRPL